MSRSISRRSLVRTLAVGAGLMPALGPLGRQFLPNAHAANTGGIRRVVFAYLPSGLPRASWHVANGATERNFTLGDQLKPIARHQSNMVVLQNLELLQSCIGIDVCPGGTPDGHATAEVMILTGSTQTLPGGPHAISPVQSIDCYLGEKIGRVATPAFPSLRLGINNRGCRWSWTGPQQRADMERDPYKVYATMFGNSMMTGARPAGPDPAALRRLARRQSVFDTVAKDLTRFRAQLPPDERPRADAQLNAIRTLESRLSAGMGQGPVLTGCDGQRPSAAALDPANRLDPEDDRNVPQLTEQMRKLIVGAFACDLTRVVSIGLYSNEMALHMRFAPINKEEDFHHFSHDGDRDNFATLLLCRTFFMENFIGKLADELAAIPEGEGSMLDNTLIFLMSEHGINHQKYGQQWLTLGGKNLGVNVGRYLRCGDGKPAAGIEHNRLLVSILNAMGLPDETYGEEVRKGRGPLPGFLA